MAVTHAQAALQAATDAVTALVDVGAGANGTLELLDGAVVVTEHDLTEPAFGAAAASGIATAAAIAAAVAIADGAAVDNWKMKDEDGNVILSGAAGMLRAITAVSAGAGGSIGVATDLTADFAAGTDFTIVGSTGNDGSYTVASVSYGAPTTTIVIEADQTLADGTVDGYAHVGEVGLDNTNVATGQTVSVSALTYRAVPN